ncbi:MAG: hypothetical protein HC802_15580, partial [Caldilineaceae bacterium]|nr:hypothetical protein [Caldilineaceae bacterium]
YVVGVVTETDIFRTFVEMLGSDEHGLRLVIEAPQGKGVLAKLAQSIADLGGNIVSVGTFGGLSPGHSRLLIKVRDVGHEQLVDALEVLGDHVIDAREV